MTSTLKQIRADLERARREVPALERVVVDVRKSAAKASTSLEKAKADHDEAVSSQTAACAAFSSEQSDERAAKVEKADRRVRLTRLALDGAETKARQATSAVAEAEAAKVRAELDVERLELAIRWCREKYRATVDAFGTSALAHIRGLLADLKGIRDARLSAFATVRENASKGFPALELEDGIVDLLAFFEGALEGGKPVGRTRFIMLEDACRAVGRASLFDDPPRLVAELVAVVAETREVAGINSGYLDGQASGPQGVLARIRAGESWAEAAVAVGMFAPTRSSSTTSAQYVDPNPGCVRRNPAPVDPSYVDTRPRLGVATALTSLLLQPSRRA